jgi:hypothetical protein
MDKISLPVILVILISFCFLQTIIFVSSFTLEEEAVFEKAQKSLQSHENQSSVGSNFVQTVNKTGIGGLVLSNAFSFYDSAGYFHVTGEVTNRSPDAMQSIGAVVAFYDSNKNVVDTDTGYVYPPVLNTGVKGAFETLGPDPIQVKKISSFKITLNGDYANSKQAALKVRIGNHYLDQFGISYTVAGDVTNIGTETTSYTEVDGIFYDKQGRVIDVTSTYPPQSDLNPGQSTPFELSAYPEGAHKITSFKVFADSSEYSSNAASG